MRLTVNQREILTKIEEAPHQYTIGIDEVGLGACAGPLVVSGVVMYKTWKHEQVRDSKKYFKSKRATAHEKRLKVLREFIIPKAAWYFTYTVDAESLDAIGIDTALSDASRAVYVTCHHHFPDSTTVMDGKLDHHLHREFLEDRVIALVGGDSLVPAVSAASILAKTTRDHYMLELDTKYPEYGFGQHKGYPTEDHRLAMEKYGVCDEHRRTYKTVRRILGKPWP